jgi:hypothetical protein
LSAFGEIEGPGFAGAFLFRLVMPGLVPGIHAFMVANKEDVDGRDA